MIFRIAEVKKQIISHLCKHNTCKMKKIILSLSLLIGFYFSVTAQFGEEEREPNHAAGLHAGGIKGVGFSYRYLPSTGYGVQITGIPILRENGDFFGSAGVSLLYSIKTFNRVNLYGYLGNNLNYSSSSYTYTDFNEEGPGTIEITEKESERIYSLGAGAGVNIRRWDVIDFTFAGGYVFRSNRSIYNQEKSTTISTSLALEIGVYYRF